MIDEEKYRKLKSAISKLKRTRDQARGAEKQLLATLQKEFKCKTLAQAEKKLARLEKEEKQHEKEFNKALKAFYEQYGDLLEAMESGDSELLVKIPASLKSAGSRKPGGFKTRKAT